MKTLKYISWLEKAYKHLDKLYAQAKTYIDEDVDDILPSRQYEAS
jgi:hypothetical protein